MMGSEKDQSTKTAIMELRRMLKDELLVVCEYLGIKVNEGMSRSEILKIVRQASEDEIQDALVMFKKKRGGTGVKEKGA